MDRAKYKKKLTKFLIKQKKHYINDEESITINKLDEKGFDIKIILAEENIEIYFSQWHTNFNYGDYRSTFRFILLGLSKNCRIKVKSKNNNDFYFQMQYYIDNEWDWDSETIYSLKKEYKAIEGETRYLMNN